ncbi:MAG: hypothetical protein H6687_03025 [Bacillales bacterium]|nr:hypothetical protein [Bacillales bacterium]
MGNYGKRVLIVILSVVLVVALALVGNAYQQREKNHYITDKNAVVYEGSYGGKTYQVTKEDIWENILYSSPMSTVEEILDKYLLASVISTIDDQSEIDEKINYLVYGTTDEETINEKKEDTEADGELWEAFYNKMNILGYYTDGTDGHNIDDYAKLMIAYDEYARYRIENGLDVGSITPDVSDETILSEYEAEYADTIALVIKFYSEDDADTFLNLYHLAIVSSKIRYYIGDSEYVVDKDDDGNYYVNDDFSYPYLEQEVTYSDGTTGYEKVPNANVETDDDGNYVWNSELDAWEYSSTTVVSNVVSYEDCDSFTTKNTAILSADQVLSLYIEMYNDYYSQQRDSLETSVVLQNFIDAFDFTTSAGLINDADVITLNAALENYGLVLVTYTDSENNTVQEIRKYIGNDEYLVETVDGVAQGVNGFPTYKEDSTNEEYIPNYKIATDGDGNPILDSEDDFMYYLDNEGNIIANDSKLAIEDQTTFDLTNTIEASNAQLYSAFVQIYKDLTGVTWSSDYSTLMENTLSQITYNYDDLNAIREDLAKEIFETLTFGDTASGSYLATPTSYDGVQDSETPYYLIYKLSTSESSTPSESELAAYKEEKIQEYLDTTGFTTMAIAELRAEAGLKIYDEFFVYEYQSDIAYDEDDLAAGVDSDLYTDYYSMKKYVAKKLVELTKEVDVMGTTVSEISITPDDLYDYALEYSSASYISSACLNAVYFTLDAFEEIHGTSMNYLTSDNWKMEEYAETAEYYNYYYEYYKSIYASYGYDYYNSLNEFLYSYGARSFDDMVSSLERSTMRDVFIYNEMVGALDTTELTDYAKALFASDKFTTIFNDYYDVDISHLLIYMDLDEDGSPDDYDKFLASFDETTGESSVLKDASGNALTLSEFNTEINKLEKLLLDYVYSSDTNFASSSETILSDFITEYNESSREDGKYKEFKALGISLMYEDLGDVTNSTVSSYVEPFQEAVTKIAEKLERVDNDLLGYSIGDGLTETSFGLHFIVGLPGDNFDKTTFEISDPDSDYAEGSVNTSSSVSESQLALYMQQYVYNDIYGDTDDPEEQAGFEYPNLPTDLTDAFDTYYSDFMSIVLDESATYHSNYIMLLTLVNESSEYQSQFEALKDIYYSVLFGDLSD